MLYCFTAEIMSSITKDGFMESRVELAEVLDVPRIWHSLAFLRFQSCCAWSGDVYDPERPFPHRRELVQALSGEYPSKDQVSGLECTSADMSAVVAA